MQCNGSVVVIVVIIMTRLVVVVDAHIVSIAALKE